jgi:hypothetical protein
VLRRTHAGDVWEQQTVMIGLTLLIVSPNYPWYGLMLLPFIVLSRRWEYVGVILALDVIYMVPAGPWSESLNQSVLLLAAAAVAGGTWLRRRGKLRLAALAGLKTEAPDPAAP